MANFITTNQETLISYQPWKGPSLNFLQNAVASQVENAITGMIQILGMSYSSTTPYILSGSIGQPVGGTLSILPGSVLVNREVFNFDSATLSGSGAFLAATTSITFDVVADPTTFTDGTVNNVHQIRKLIYSWQSSSVGYINMNNRVKLSAAPTSLGPSSNVIALTGSFFGGVNGLTITKDLTGRVNLYGYIEAPGVTITVPAGNDVPMFTIPLNYAPINFGSSNFFTVFAGLSFNSYGSPYTCGFDGGALNLFQFIAIGTTYSIVPFFGTGPFFIINISWLSSVGA